MHSLSEFFQFFEKLFFYNGFSKDNKLVAACSRNQFIREKIFKFMCHSSQKVVTSGEAVLLIEHLKIHDIYIDDNGAVGCGILIMPLQMFQDSRKIMQSREFIYMIFFFDSYNIFNLLHNVSIASKKVSRHSLTQIKISIIV